MEIKCLLYIFNLAPLQEDSHKLELSFQWFILESGGWFCIRETAQQKKGEEEAAAAIKKHMPNKDQIYLCFYLAPYSLDYMRNWGQ